MSEISNSSYAEDVAAELDLTSAAYAEDVAGEVELASSAYGEDVAEAINSGAAHNYTLRVLHHNIGHFSQGVYAWSSINSANEDGYPYNHNRNYAVQLARWKRFIQGSEVGGVKVKGINAEVFNMVEYSAIFGKDNGVDVALVPTTEILNGYDVSVGNFNSGNGGWWVHAVASKYEVVSAQDVQIGQLYGDIAYAHVATVKINGKDVKIASTHLNWTQNTAHKESRLAEIQALVTLLKDEPYAILSGDFNVDNISEFNPFVNNGFTCALYDADGHRTFTYPATNSRNTSSIPRAYFDNIITKGFAMSNVRVLDLDVFGDGTLDVGMLSDHCAVVCDLTMVEEGGEE